MKRVIRNNHIELPQYQVALMLIPKAAGSAIRQSVQMAGVTHRMNLSPSQIREGLMRIAVVRNSWDRIVSCWHQKTNKRWPDKVAQLRDPRFYTGMPFGEFLEVVADDHRANHHFYPQNELLEGRYQAFWRLEELAERWVERFDFPLLKANVNPHRKHYSEYYNERMRDQVGALYASEIDEFGFTFR